MKKLISLAVVAVMVAAIGLSSCSKKEKCWEISMAGAVTIYYWGEKPDAGKYPGYTVKSSSKSEKDCQGGDITIPME